MRLCLLHTRYIMRIMITMAMHYMLLLIFVRVMFENVNELPQDKKRKARSIVRAFCKLYILKYATENN